MWLRRGGGAYASGVNGYPGRNGDSFDNTGLYSYWIFL